jgi:hypothetical protein
MNDYILLACISFAIGSSLIIFFYIRFKWTRIQSLSAIFKYF